MKRKRSRDLHKKKTKNHRIEMEKFDTTEQDNVLLRSTGLSKTAFEIAKEQVSADYQKHAAAKRFETQKELLLQEKHHVEAQLSQCRVKNIQLHEFLKKSEEIARHMTERCRSLELARKSEETLRMQAENRESSLLNLLLAEESRRSQQESAQMELEKKISQIHCTNTIFDHLESTITDLKEQLLQNQRVITKLPNDHKTRELEQQLLEVTVQNQLLREDVSRLQNRIPESASISSSMIEKITKPLLEQQAKILKEKEVMDSENLRLRNENLELKAFATLNSDTLCPTHCPYVLFCRSVSPTPMVFFAV